MGLLQEPSALKQNSDLQNEKEKDNQKILNIQKENNDKIEHQDLVIQEQKGKIIQLEKDLKNVRETLHEVYHQGKNEPYTKRKCVNSLDRREFSLKSRHLPLILLLFL